MSVSLNVNEKAHRPYYCWQYCVIVREMGLITDLTYVEEQGCGIIQKWIQSTDQAMPEVHSTTRLFSYMSINFSYLLNQFFPHINQFACLLPWVIVCL